MFTVVIEVCVYFVSILSLFGFYHLSSNMCYVTHSYVCDMIYSRVCDLNHQFLVFVG